MKTRIALWPQLGSSPLLMLVLVLAVLLGRSLAAPTLYVENSVGQSVWALDAASGKILATIPLPGSPDGLALCPDQGRLYVAGGDAGTISVIELGSNKILRTVKVGGAALGLALSPDCSRLYTAAGGSNTVIAVDTNNFLTQEVAVGQDPQAVALGPEGRWLISLNYASKDLSVLNAQNLHLEQTLAVGNGPHSWSLSPDGRWLAVGAIDSREVLLLDTQTLQVVSTYTSDAAPEGLAFRTNTELWISSLASNYVEVLHLMGQDQQQMLMPRRYTARIQTGPGPFGFTFSKDGRWAYVSNMLEGSVVKVDTQSRQVVARFMVGGEPHRLVLVE